MSADELRRRILAAVDEHANRKPGRGRPRKDALLLPTLARQRSFAIAREVWLLEFDAARQLNARRRQLNARRQVAEARGLSVDEVRKHDNRNAHLKARTLAPLRIERLMHRLSHIGDAYKARLWRLSDGNESE